jgi:hypothetical protein
MCYRQNLTQTDFNTLNILMKTKLHKNFHEMFGIAGRVVSEGLI